MNSPISILFAGDFCAANPFQVEMSDEVKSLFSSSDFKVLNFEGVLQEAGRLNIANKSVLPQSSESPKWCEDCGFQAVSLANNHSLDREEEGLLFTKQQFIKLSACGAGLWNEAYKVHVFNVKGVKIGLFCATMADLTSLKDEWTDMNKVGTAWINHPSVNKLLMDAKKTVDFLIVFSHGGAEYFDNPLPEWRDRYRNLIDLGVDAVVASHPHVVQGIEIYKDKPICYSLGNFFFDYFRDEKYKPKLWDNGLVVQLLLSDKIQVIPYLIKKNANRISIDTDNYSLSRWEKINNLLSDNGKYMKEVNAEVMHYYNKYLIWMLSGLNAQKSNGKFINLIHCICSLLFGKEDLRVALHQLRGEDSRWVINRALKLISGTML